MKKQTSQSVSTGSDSEGMDSDKPLLHFKERDVAVSYKPGRKKKQAKKVELSPLTELHLLNLINTVVQLSIANYH